MRNPQSILITGASSGIGAVLARTYAHPGISLALTGRDRPRLDHIAQICRMAGATVHLRSLDIADEAAVTDWVAEIDHALSLDLVIAGAGMTGGHRGPGMDETLADIRRILEVNFHGACTIAQAAIPGMRRRRRGQIAFVSSIAGLRGLPYSLAYCASKAALIAYGEGLRAHMRPDGVVVSVILPGFVDTPMAARVSGPKPLMVTSERAARIIRSGLARDRACITFPFLLGLGTRIIALLPAGPVDSIMNRINVTITPSG
jgi:short-subunit dehydrogenase